MSRGSAVAGDRAVPGDPQQPRPGPDRTTRLYVLLAALLIVHEIDSAYWQEWRLFGLPGGVQAFVALHLPLVAVVLVGLERLATGHRSGPAFALLLAAAGVLTVAIHGAFLLAGREEFRLPLSLVLLAATLPASLGLAVMARRALKAPARPDRPE
jgi:hypothetical protein